MTFGEKNKVDVLNSNPFHLYICIHEWIIENDHLWDPLVDMIYLCASHSSNETLKMSLTQNHFQFHLESLENYSLKYLVNNEYPSPPSPQACRFLIQHILQKKWMRAPPNLNTISRVNSRMIESLKSGFLGWQGLHQLNDTTWSYYAEMS